MKKSVLILIILLLVSMVSMVSIIEVSPVDANSTELHVDPPSVMNSTLQPELAKTIRPMGDGTYTDWTNRTLTIRPDGDGTNTEWTGRTLTLRPNDHGTYTNWSSWVHIIPDENGIYTGWDGYYTFWDDDWKEPHDGDETRVSTNAPNKNESSTFENPPTEPEVLDIDKVRLTMVAKYWGSSDDKVRMMLLGPFNATVSGIVEDDGWDGWTRNGTSPWLDAADYNEAKSYIYTSVPNDKIGNFTFEDVPTGKAWGGVTLNIKTWRSPLSDDRIDIYLYNGTSWSSAYHVYPETTIAPGTDMEVDVSSFLNTEAKINAAQMRIEKVTEGAANDTIYIDHVCLFCRAVDYGLETSLSIDYTEYTYEWLTNPATDSPWTWLEIDSLEAGVQSVQFGDTWNAPIRVTQLYASVLTEGLYTDLDERPDHNGDIDYVAVAAKATHQSSALQNATEDWSIAKVQVGIVARATGGETKVIIMLVFGGTVYEGVTIDTLSTAYTEYTYEWLTNPATDSPWTWEDINATEAGVQTREKGAGWGGGEIRVTQLYVKVIEPGTYAHWNETTPDEDTYVSATADGLNESSTLQDHTAEDWSIARVQVNIVAKTYPSYAVPADEKVTIILVVGGTVYEGSTYGLTTDYSTYTHVWTQNPRYNMAWNWTAIDALEAGVKSLQVGGSWKGEIRVTQLYVVVGEPRTYTAWDDWPDHNEDNDYVSATMHGLKVSSELENPTYPTWNIARVRVVFYARTTVPTDEKVQPILVVGGIAYPGKAYTPDTTYVKYTGDWGKNPDTGFNWTWPQIDSLQAGVQSRVGADKLWTGEIRVTQLYVEVAGPRAFTVDILVKKVSDLYTYDLMLNYSTAVLSATSITVGDFLDDPVYGYAVTYEEMNDDLGYVFCSVSQAMGEYTGVSGNGTLLTITFLVDSYGESSLALDPDRTKLWKLVAGWLYEIDYQAYEGYFSNKIIGDVNGDRTVNALDLFDLGKAYGSSSGQPAYDARADFDRDGDVDNDDLVSLAENYGKSI